MRRGELVYSLVILGFVTSGFQRTRGQVLRRWKSRSHEMRHRGERGCSRTSYRDFKIRQFGDSATES
jgi:hypothetical protein